MNKKILLPVLGIYDFWEQSYPLVSMEYLVQQWTFRVQLY